MPRLNRELLILELLPNHLLWGQLFDQGEIMVANNKLRRIVDFAVYSIHLIATYTLLIMLVLVCADIIAIELFHNPILGTLEIVEELMVIACFLAFGYTQASEGHLGVTFLTSRMPEKLRRGLSVMGSIISLAVMGIILWRNIALLERYISIGSVKQVLYYFPLWPTALFMVIGSFAFLLSVLLNLIKMLSGRS